MCKTNPHLLEAVNKSNSGQYVLPEEETLEKVQEYLYTRPCRIVVSKKRTLEAAGAYKGKKVCIHNFASATNPGGGVAKGSNAQEKAICRCSSLYFNIGNADVKTKFHDKHRQMLRAGNMDAAHSAILQGWWRKPWHG